MGGGRPGWRDEGGSGMGRRARRRGRGGRGCCGGRRGHPRRSATPRRTAPRPTAPRGTTPRRAAPWRGAAWRATWRQAALARRTLLRQRYHLHRRQQKEQQRVTEQNEGAGCERLRRRLWRHGDGAQVCRGTDTRKVQSSRDGEGRENTIAHKAAKKGRTPHPAATRKKICTG